MEIRVAWQVPIGNIFWMTSYQLNISFILFIIKKFNTTPRETQTGTVKCERHTCRLICNNADMIIEGRERVTCKFLGSNKRPVWSGKLGLVNTVFIRTKNKYFSSCRLCPNPSFEIARADRLSFNCRRTPDGAEEICDVKCKNGFVFQREPKTGSISKTLTCFGSSKTWEAFDEEEFKCRRTPFRR